MVMVAAMKVPRVVEGGVVIREVIVQRGAMGLVMVVVASKVQQMPRVVVRLEGGPAIAVEMTLGGLVLKLEPSTARADGWVLEATHMFVNDHWGKPFDYLLLLERWMLFVSHHITLAFMTTFLA